MIRCNKCGTESQDSCLFCDECGQRLIQPDAGSSSAAYVPPSSNGQMATMIEPINVTSVGQELRPVAVQANDPVISNAVGNSVAMSAKLVIERGDGPAVEFRIAGTEAIIGRWDADNGVFPDVDLDSHDSEAKVSRRHARIKKNGQSYLIEDLGSTNGTYVNRGRRLLPGMPQIINSGDEIIVGKTFLRFHALD